MVEEFWDLPLIETLYGKSVRISPDAFRDAFHQLFDRRGRLLLTGSARQALQTVLESSAARSRRRRVLLSSFNCRVVKEAVRRAGLLTDTFDFATPTGQIHWEVVADSLTDEHLAVVVPHFFGIPTDFRPALSAARRRGVIVIEDCAHTLAASIAGTPAGLLGDAAIFSFNYDKPISLAGGGALLLNDSRIRIDPERIEAPPRRQLELRQFRQLAASLLYARARPDRRPLVARIGAKLRISPYTLPRLPTGIGSLRSAAGIWQLEKYAEIRARRNRNAQILRDSLQDLCWHVSESVEAAHLKWRVVVRPSDAAYAVQQCRRQRIGVGNSNWPKPIDSDGVERVQVNARRAAIFGLDVPVHQNLSQADLQCIASAFARARAPDGPHLPG